MNCKPNKNIVNGYRIKKQTVNKTFITPNAKPKKKSCQQIALNSCSPSVLATAKHFQVSQKIQITTFGTLHGPWVCPFNFQGLINFTQVSLLLVRTKINPKRLGFIATVLYTHITACRVSNNTISHELKVIFTKGGREGIKKKLCVW